MYIHVHSHTHTDGCGRKQTGHLQGRFNRHNLKGPSPRQLGSSWASLVTWKQPGDQWLFPGFRDLREIYMYIYNYINYIYIYTVISYNKKKTVHTVSPNRILLEWLKFLSLFLHLLLPETRLALIEVKGSALLLCYAQWPVHGDPWCSTLWRRDVNIVTIC